MWFKCCDLWFHTVKSLTFPKWLPPCMLGSVSNFSAIFLHLENPQRFLSSLFLLCFFIPSYEFHITTSLFITFLHLTANKFFDTHGPSFPCHPSSKNGAHQYCMPGTAGLTAPSPAGSGLLLTQRMKNPSSCLHLTLMLTADWETAVSNPLTLLQGPTWNGFHLVSFLKV